MASTTNPYDFSNPADAANAAGIIAGSMPPPPTTSAPTVTPGQGTAATATASNATASNANASQGTAQTYDPTTATGNYWEIDPATQTVQGQLTGIIDKNSELMQRAESKAMDSMNSRGLLNSSMAVGAGQAAVMDAAMPIATQDASTYANAAKYKADTDNAMAQFNANALNTAGQHNTAQQNAMAQLNAQLATDVAKYNAGNETDVSKFNAANQTDVSKQNASMQTETSQQNAALATDASKAQASLEMQSQLANQDAALKQSMQQYDAALKLSMQGVDDATKMALQQLDADTRLALGQIEAQYKTQMQTSQSMAATYQSLVDNITRVMQDKDMDAAAKQATINSLTQLYNNSLAIQEEVSGLELGNLLSPDVFNNPGAVTGATPAQAPIVGAMQDVVNDTSGGTGGG